MNLLAKSLRALFGHQPGNGVSAPQFLGNGFDQAAWLARVRASTSLFPPHDGQALEQLKAAVPGQVKAAVEAGNHILRHQFNLLGSGPYCPVDPDRQSVTGYVPIDWNLDPVSGLRFPSGIHHKEWDLWKMRPGNADVKLPWELARCQHWPALAQAWLLTGDARFADEIFAQRADFDEANPVGYGIHWTCTMDIAIRAANWALALEMIRAHEASKDKWLSAYRSLYTHGQFIRANLEDKYEVTSNHFLSNVVGLYYLARVFHETPEAQEWETFSRNAIEREIDVQVLADGADFESSVPYHRLVAELFLGAVRVANHAGQPFSHHLHSRLQDMVNYHLALLRPDGRMPQLGDADDGRLHIFSDYGALQPQDGRHLLASASTVMGEPSWLAYAGPQNDWEAYWWSGQRGAAQVEAANLPAIDRHYADAGVVIHRSGGLYLAITNGIVGTKGFGNHKHNDLLSFEYHSAGMPLFVDPGSYVYTSDLAARNLFRGTGYHNTLMIDGIEQNETNPEWIFRLFEKAKPETLEYQVTAETVVYRGQHLGYTRLEYPVVHQRQFELNRETGVLAITDRLDGTGPHRISWHFHLAPGVEPQLETGAFRLWRKEDGAQWQLEVPANVEARSAPAWYSPSYGVRILCKALELEAEVTLSSDACWHFVITPIGARK